ncbi:MAG: aminopeptidase, partial [Lachnospiraceae bacterium]|nr:aminopeptidase [Lachnospiraceae bacterium]
MERENIWKSFSEGQRKELDQLSKGYIDFISEAKTERECVTKIVNEIEDAGYVELARLVSEGKKLKAGDKVYAVNMNKAVIMAQIGTKPLEEGLNILGAHIDSPRMDIKQNPLYEEGGFAYLDTHYYGGVKKYQWVTLPLAVHGVFVKKNGETVEVNVGEDPDDPVFFVSDLLIHLAQEQLEKKAAKVIEGEALDLIVGNEPLRIKADQDKTDAESEKDAGKEKAKDAVKKGVLKILQEQYGVEEEDFLSAELEVVPAGRAREAGFDRSMVLGYGQDDRVCAYTSYQAMLRADMDLGSGAFGALKRTAVCILVDKEEIGSVGATGMQSRFFENTMAEILALAGETGNLALRRCLSNSFMLSSDVSSAFDPTYASSFDKNNVAYLGKGMVFNKFTG